MLGVVSGADVVILGEVHDNPHHHDLQTKVIEHVQPKAIVWEMLDQTQASRVTRDIVEHPETLEEVLGWSETGWPDFVMYAPIFAAAPDARTYGAHVSRPDARTAMETGVVVAFGDEAARFGLADPLPEGEQSEREAFQLRAHCDALPVEMLPMMVDVQRLRDASLARAIGTAFDETGGPVAVITGNGHARADWGIPVYLERILPDITIVSIGQGEDAAGAAGEFDLVLDAPGIERPDPCLAFRQGG
ncbi:ChaN family lipoprotein [Thalassococcus sp. S3]|uniref:ChaN family lipoprotein n=1 Tax=Thalassococcus sp. S3 TaxID=2017482 RepID=UPI00352E5A83